MMRSVYYTVTLILAAACSQALGQMRGVWICSGDLRSEDSIISSLDKCAAMGLTDVFLQVRTAGDAAYDSATEPPPHKALDDDLDVLALACDHGHNLGLRVHAWLNINYCAPGPGLPASSRHVANRHPDWVACGRDGVSMALMKKPELRRQDSEGLYLSPDAPGVPEYYQAIVREILERYHVDGIHLDFIRYANYRFDYGGSLAQDFRDEYGVDPAYLVYEKGQCESGDYCEGLELWRRIMNLRWMQMRADALTGLVRAIHLAQVQTRPDAILSAAVWFPQPWAYSYVGQDWMRWLDEDIVDVAIPMAYAKSDEPLGSYLPGVKEYLESGRMTIGLGAWRLDGAGIIHKMEMVGNYGGGWVLFDYASLAGREKVASALSKYIGDNQANAQSYAHMIPGGWQMGWANRRPLASQSAVTKSSEAGVDADQYERILEEAEILSLVAGKAWGNRDLIPPVNELTEWVLPWVDSCNQNIALLPKPGEKDLRAYFQKHQTRYLMVTRKKSGRQKHTKEEIEVAYQKNRDKVYRDAMLDEISRVVNDVIKLGKVWHKH